MMSLFPDADAEIILADFSLSREVSEEVDLAEEVLAADSEVSEAAEVLEVVVLPEVGRWRLAFGFLRLAFTAIF